MASRLLDPRRAETMLLQAWMQHRSGAHQLAQRSVCVANGFPVSDLPLYLRLKQVPELASGTTRGAWRRMVSEAKNAVAIPIRFSIR